MATDEEIHVFVDENRELIERMMAAQRESAETAKSIGKEVIKFGFKSSYVAADITKRKSEEFLVAVYRMLTDPEAQRHFMVSGLEFLAGLNAMAKNAPMPEFLREAAAGAQNNARAAACMTNENCPLKAGTRAEAPAEEGPREETPAVRTEALPDKAEDTQ